MIFYGYACVYFLIYNVESLLLKARVGMEFGNHCSIMIGSFIN